MKSPFYNFRTFLLLLVILIFNLNGLLAQADWAIVKQFYQKGQYVELKQALSKADAKQQKSLEFIFFSSLFEKDGEKAVKNYQFVFDRADGWLKEAAAKKLFNYYFARGLYLKANSYRNYLAQKGNTQTEPMLSKVSSVQEQAAYFIQLGAFSSPENAEKRLKVLKKNGISAEIKIRKINNHNYYCVWVKGRSNYAGTNKMARQIKKQLNLEYRIIKE